ncbi:hypothetical protein RB593_006173 [Gaeumannomyces tritici]
MGCLLVGAWLGSIAIQALVIRSFALGYIGVRGWEIPLDLFQQSGIGIFFTSVFPCWPIAKSYDLAFPPAEGSCMDRPTMYKATAALGVITDVMIIAIPIPMVTVVTSIVRLYLLIAIMDEVDQTWGGGPVVVWISIIEANLLIMCACLSTLRHFFRAVAPGLLSSVWRKSKSKGTGSLSNSHGSELRTIDQIPSKGLGKKQFMKLDGRADVESQAYAGRSSLETKRSDEAGSDRGIVQTTTTQVSYTQPRR